MVGIGSGIRRIGRFGMAGVALSALVLALGPAVARAEAPIVTITSPSTGTLTNQRSIAIAGTTDDMLDSVTVEIFAGTGTGGALVGQELAVPSEGAWTLQSPSLEDGTYTAIASQGAVEPGFSEEVTFTVDATPPTVTLDAVAAATNDPTPSLGGSAGSASGDSETVSVIVYQGAVAGGPEAASGSVQVHSGAWSFTPSTLADGTYTAQAFQGDEADNVGSSGTSTFRVDTTVPAPLTLNPVASVVGTASPSFGGSGSQGPGDGSVHVVIDGKQASEVSVSAGTWSYTSSSLSDGTHTVLAEQIDEAGNVSKTNTASFRVDTTKPSVSLTGPKADEQLKSSLVEFHGGAGSATGDQSAVTVEVFGGKSTAPGSLEQTFTVTRSGSGWSSGSSGPRLSNGVYTVRAKQLDSVGNAGVSEAVAFEVDSPAPEVTLSAMPRFIPDATPSFAGAAETSGEAKPEVTVKVWHGTSASGSIAETATGPVSAGRWAAGLTESLADGTYTAQAEQPPSVAKNPAGVSETTTFTVDTEAPQPTLSAPDESSGLETVSGSAGTAPGDRQQVTAELFSGSAVEGGALVAITVPDNPATGAWSATFAGLGAGQYTVVARQSDEAGNTGSSGPQTFTVTTPPTPSPPTSPAPPVASFTWVPATPVVGQAVSFVSKSTDASAPITGFAWDLSGAGSLTAGGPVVTSTFSTPGAHTVRLQVSDANGLSSAVAATVLVSAQQPRLMQPFPIVRIAGAETASGARIKLLTVQAPPGATVAVTCKGRGCKTKSEQRLAQASKTKGGGTTKSGAVMLAFPRFQRSLKAGALLQIRVTLADEIGKYTSFRIRRRKLPVRVDKCLQPPSTSPLPCPAQ
jgi:large repetitive protein